MVPSAWDTLASCSLSQLLSLELSVHTSLCQEASYDLSQVMSVFDLLSHSVLRKRGYEHLCLSWFDQGWPPSLSRSSMKLDHARCAPGHLGPQAGPRAGVEDARGWASDPWSTVRFAPGGRVPTPSWASVSNRENVKLLVDSLGGTFQLRNSCISGKSTWSSVAPARPVDPLLPGRPFPWCSCDWHMLAPEASL